jgi:putative FmdB family regulatory protein
VPLYEYVCKECGHKSEVRQSIHNAPVIACPECRGEMRRIISGGSCFIVRGRTADKAFQPRCGKDQTCCGSATPCESPGCGGGNE